VLLDWGDIVVHIFREEERKYYDLEGLWGDAPAVRVGDSSADDAT
jgi:ribosome-associated protein